MTEPLNVLPAWLREDERRCVALVRCLLLEPRLLLLESPITGLDLRMAERLRELLQEWSHSERRALVIADNDLTLARRADQLLVLGKQACYPFSDWDSLCASDKPEVSALRRLLTAAHQE